MKRIWKTQFAYHLEVSAGDDGPTDEDCQKALCEKLGISEKEAKKFERKWSETEGIV